MLATVLPLPSFTRPYSASGPFALAASGATSQNITDGLSPFHITVERSAEGTSEARSRAAAISAVICGADGATVGEGDESAGEGAGAPLHDDDHDEDDD
jgi:hypothetical protein